MKMANILLVDDEAAIREALRDSLLKIEKEG